MLGPDWRLHHVTWVVADLNASLARLAPLIGSSPPIREELPARGVTTARFRCGDHWLVLVQPLGPGQPADRLATAGEGPLLMSFGVNSLDASLAALADRGVRAAGARRPGIAGWQVVDLELRLPGGIILQLCEDRASS